MKLTCTAGVFKSIQDGIKRERIAAVINDINRANEKKKLTASAEQSAE
jgi:hypothetical protein